MKEQTKYNLKVIGIISGVLALLFITIWLGDDVMDDFLCNIIFGMIGMCGILIFWYMIKNGGL